MAGKFSRSRALMKASAAVLQSDKSLLIFPLLSGACTLLVAASFLLPVILMTIGGEHVGQDFHQRLSTGSYLLMFAFYLVQYFCHHLFPDGPDRRGTDAFARRTGQRVGGLCTGARQGHAHSGLCIDRGDGRAGAAHGAGASWADRSSRRRLSGVGLDGGDLPRCADTCQPGGWAGRCGQAQRGIAQAQLGRKPDRQ